MIIDMHCHVVGNGKDLSQADRDVFFNASDNQHWFTWALFHMLESGLERMGAEPRGRWISADSYLDLVFRLLIEAKEIDAIVLLALDAVYQDGVIDPVRTDLCVSNRYLSGKVKDLNKALKAMGSCKRFYYGASVSPNRKKDEWLEELDFVKADPDSVLMKWIPSTQHIRVGKVSSDFYESLSETGLPLLCHVGPEYSFPEGIRKKSYDDFKLLRRPLDAGVRVIAAHCASPVFPFRDPNRMKQFRALMDEYNRADDVRLWGDISALSLSTRLPLIGEIVDLFPPEWLVHGSDFPIPIDGRPHLPLLTHDITPEEYLEIVATKNPFDRDVKIKKAHGFAASVFENAVKVLRLPA